MTATTDTPAVAAGEGGTAGVTRATVDLPADAANWIQLIRSCDQAIAELEERKAAARRQLEAMLGDNEIGRINGAPVVHWTFVRGGRFQQRKFAEQHPDLYDAFTAPQTTRRFALAKDDEQ